MGNKFTFVKYVRVEVVAAEPFSLISKIAEQGIEIFKAEQCDLITVQITVRRTKYAVIKHLVEENGGSCRTVGRIGYLWQLGAIRKRPLLVTGLLIFVLTTLSMSERILFVNIVGNEAVPEALILQQAADCGISIGRTRRAVRSEEVKNALLAKNPQLQWVGVNTKGSVATIHVKERSNVNVQKPKQHLVSGIVASRDGVISELVVLKGTTLCRTGQSVKKGDLLVSGYTDCGLKVIAQNAHAEIFAYTLRANAFICPNPTIMKTQCKDIHVCKSLRIGKKVIKLCNHSGISDVTCVKMYTEDFLKLPGGFQLPVSIITEEYKSYDSVKNPAVDAADFLWLEEFSCDYLKSQMISGEILRQENNMILSEAGCCLDTEFVCEEMIGQVKYEETLKENAEDN